MNKQLILSMAQKVHDPYADLYYERDMENGGTGPVSFYDEITGLNLEWDRAKSNDTVTDPKRGFSFYYARLVLIDRSRVGFEDKPGPNPREERFLFVGKPFSIQSEPLLVVVHLSYLEDNLVRVISAYESDNVKFARAYNTSVWHHEKTDQQFKRNVEYMTEQVKYL